MKKVEERIPEANKELRSGKELIEQLNQKNI